MILSPRRAFLRRQYRFAYEAIDNTRTRKKRTGLLGTGDQQLTAARLSKLRNICRDMGRNNPLAVGLLETERDGVIGEGVKIQAKTKSKKFNAEAEQAWREKMVDKACDVTGRFNFNTYLGMLYFSYRRDGDVFTLFTDEGLQAIEGEAVGTPYNWTGKQAAINPKSFRIVNGVAYSNKSQLVVGYYIGSPNKWGFILPSSYKPYEAKHIHHSFNPRRFSQSRGEPALTPSVNYIDTLCGYIDAELVAAKVAACFSVFIAQKNSDLPPAFTGGVNPTGESTESGVKHEKIEPGVIMYGAPGEEPSTIGQNRPGTTFDPFVSRLLSLIGRPLCMPLMLVTLDFSGATFMNARIAYQKMHKAWQREQKWVVQPFVSRVWRRFVEKEFKKKDPKWFAHDVICNRWPYVDPFKEAKADEQQLKNGTTTRKLICARQGEEFEDVTEQLAKEQELRNEKNLPETLVKGQPNAVPK